MEKFEKISSADFIAKNLKKISSVEFIDADCIEKKFALLISLKKISTVDFIEKNFSNPKPQNDRPVVFKRRTPNAKRRTPNADFHGPTGRSFLRFLLGPPIDFTFFPPIPSYSSNENQLEGRVPLQ